MHVEIASIIRNESKVTIEGTSEIPACLFTVAYYLQRQVKSVDWLFNQLEDDESAVVQVLPDIKSLQRLLTVS